MLNFTITLGIPSPLVEDTMKTSENPGHPTIRLSADAGRMGFPSFPNAAGPTTPFSVLSVSWRATSSSILFDFNVSTLLRTRKLGCFGYDRKVSRTVGWSSDRVQELDTSWTTPIRSECWMEWRNADVKVLSRWCFRFSWSVTKPGVSKRMIWVSFLTQTALVKLRVVWTLLDVGHIYKNKFIIK